MRVVKRLLAKPWNNPGVPKKKDRLGGTTGGTGGAGSEEGGVALCRGLNKVHQERRAGDQPHFEVADWPCACVYVCVCKVGVWGEGARQDPAFKSLDSFGGKSSFRARLEHWSQGKVGWSPAPPGG